MVIIWESLAAVLSYIELIAFKLILEITVDLESLLSTFLYELTIFYKSLLVLVLDIICIFPCFIYFNWLVCKASNKGIYWAALLS